MTDANEQIREIRRHELDEVIDFAHQHGSAIEASGVHPALSVLARDEAGAPRGAALLRATGTHATLEVVTAEEAGDAEGGLTRRLIDKALSRMRCRHVHRCSIRFPRDDTAERLWRAARWTADTAPETPRAA